MLPVASFYSSSTPEFRSSLAEVKGGRDGEIVGRVQKSTCARIEKYADANELGVQRNQNYPSSIFTWFDIFAFVKASFSFVI